MKSIIVEENNQGSRVDKFLAKEFFSYSRGEIGHLIKAGAVTVNMSKIKPSYVLRLGDKIDIDLPEKNTELYRNSDLKLDVLYADVNIIIIDKPAGIQVHPSHTEEKRTIVNALVALFPEIASIGDGGAFSSSRPGVVHRLDKDTSGVMVFARNQAAFDALKSSFKARKVSKQYLAIVVGVPHDKKGVIDKALAKSSTYKKQVIANSKTKTTIREAITGYRVVEEMGGYALIEAAPKTGRMHQIRAHLAYLGHPILGDKIYGKRFLTGRQDCGNIGRQMLHSRSLTFQLFGRKFSFQSPIPADFEHCIEVLTKG